MKTAGASAIEHVVLLLMENRPFDQFYGFAQPELKGKIDGLSGKECFPRQRRNIRSSAGAHVAATGHSHPLDGKTQIMFNIFDKDPGGPEDKWVSFAENDITPPGEHDKLHWMRATELEVSDAMPTRFEAVAGAPDVYKLKNMNPDAIGYVCEKAQSSEYADADAGAAGYYFLHTSCNQSGALPLRVTLCTDCTDNASYIMQSQRPGPTMSKYMSFCTGGCSGQRWMSVSYAKASAMNVRLSDPGVTPPPPPPPTPLPPSCVESGAEPYVCKYGGPWLGHPPLGWNSSWDGFNPICPGGLPELCPGGKCPPLCTNGVGNVAREAPCKWPLTYKGQTYDGTDGCPGGDDSGGYGFCSPFGGVYNGSYGGCKPCGSDPSNTSSGFWRGCTQFPRTNQGGWLIDGTSHLEAIHQFSPQQVPIHIRLAQEFGLFDQYHTSFPGPSTPNHLYLMTGTNAGCDTTGQDFKCTKGAKYPQKTIFQSLADQNHSWR